MSPAAAKAYGIIDEVFTGAGESLIAQAKDEGARGGEGAAAAQHEELQPAATAGASARTRVKDD
jgi:hypothetical protein